MSVKAKKNNQCCGVNSSILRKAAYVALSLWLFLFLFVFFLFFLNSQSIFEKDSVVNVSLVDNGEREIDDDLRSVSFSSFFDSFFNNINIGHLDNLYYDYEMTALMFPPSYSWEKVEAGNLNEELKKQFTDFSVNDFDWFVKGSSDNKVYKDKYCIRENCLKQVGLDVSYNNSKLSLPKTPKGYDLKAVSIGKAGNTFLLSMVVYKNESYQAIIYKFNGKEFSRLLADKELVSPYFSLCGFGGVESDFLVICGSKKGIAYRIKGSSVYNISQFFDFRVMHEGFKPEIIRVDNKGLVSWYVFSLSNLRPNLIKLWENSGEVKGLSGAVSFKGDIGSGSLFIPYQANSEEISLLMKNGEDYFIFTDKGFINDKDGVFISGKGPNYEEVFKFNIKKIEKIDLKMDSVSANKLGKGDIKLYFKEIHDSASEATIISDLDKDIDNVLWKELPLDGQIDLSSNEIEKFRLKLVFPPEGNKFYSPFFEELLFNFNYSKG